MSMVPSESVDRDSLASESVTIRYANGGTRIRKVDQVEIEVGEKKLIQNVALANTDELGEKGLLAINISDDLQFSILKDFRERTKTVLSIETKHKIQKERKKKWKEQNLLN